jgi:hypothetical protein
MLRVFFYYYIVQKLQMNNTIFFIAVIIIVMILIMCRHDTDRYYTNRQGFMSKPTPEQVKKYGGSLLANAKLLRVGFEESKNSMPWIDAVVYEEARQLELKNNLNHSTIDMLFK